MPARCGLQRFDRGFPGDKRLRLFLWNQRLSGYAALYLYRKRPLYGASGPDRRPWEKEEILRKGPTGKNFHHENVLDELTDKVLEKIEEYKEEPFFLYFPMPAPHTPILPAPEFQGKSGTNEYGDFVLHCDHVVGRVVEKLKETSLFENTILIYTSDNGCSPMANYEELKAKGHNPSYVFRGTKADIYEGGHRIPLIVQWPEAIKAGGGCCDRIVCLSDLMATMADVLGVDLPDTCAEDSVSNLPLWKDPGSPEVRKDIVHQSIDGSLSIRRGQYKLELCPGSGGWSDPLPGKEDPTAPDSSSTIFPWISASAATSSKTIWRLASELKRF